MFPGEKRTLHATFASSRSRPFHGTSMEEATEKKVVIYVLKKVMNNRKILIMEIDKTQGTLSNKDIFFELVIVLYC